MTDQELKQYLEAMEGRIDGRMEKMADRLVEKMRDMQTELLRGFAAFSEGQNSPANRIS